ncbi:MAG: hypothetical protein KKA62_00005 [Nanoarchaeota archaeon]|nr:hypothetical protein [Nanoarchaeota archaeon]MBU1644367.1 hypothetical protein [Nanoarchaeota archaeon]MBU1976319.1 hypothetical protein [Nanoarchaeota archaeon]
MDKKEQCLQRNLEVVENFAKEVQSILYSRMSQRSKMKAFYSARYWAGYFMEINNHVAREL